MESSGGSIGYANVSHVKFMFPSDSVCRGIPSASQWGHTCKYVSVPTTLGDLYTTLPINKWGRPSTDP